MRKGEPVSVETFNHAGSTDDVQKQARMQLRA